MKRLLTKNYIALTFVLGGIMASIGRVIVYGMSNLAGSKESPDEMELYFPSLKRALASQEEYERKLNRQYFSELVASSVEGTKRAEYGLRCKSSSRFVGGGYFLSIEVQESSVHELRLPFVSILTQIEQALQACELREGFHAMGGVVRRDGNFVLVDAGGGTRLLLERVGPGNTFLVQQGGTLCGYHLQAGESIKATLSESKSGSRISLYLDEDITIQVTEITKRKTHEQHKTAIQAC